MMNEHSILHTLVRLILQGKTVKWQQDMKGRKDRDNIDLFAPITAREKCPICLIPSKDVFTNI